MNGGAPPAARRTIFIVCPGGLENGGGIGRMMGYFLQAKSAQGGPRYVVVDSRGKWYLGASPRFKILSAAYLAGAVLRLVWGRFAAAPCLAHVNITGRGSTLRKIVLLAVLRRIAMPYVLHVHEPDYAADFRARGKRMQALVARAFQGAAATIVLGQGDRAALVPLLGLDAARVHVLHNAVPDPRPVLPKPAHEGPCRILFLGYLGPRKGVPELLRALATQPLAGLAWQLTLAGGGAVDEYRRLAEELGIGARVVFPGWLDEAGVRAACAAADILALPSHAEGMAMSVLEGMAHGLAVITTPVGAHAEIIEADVHGVLVPPGDVPALAAALRRLVTDPEERRRLQGAARQQYEMALDVEIYARRLVWVYERPGALPLDPAGA